MKKTELINEIAKNAGIDKKTAAAALDAATDAITDALAAGEKIQLIGFGTFEVKDVAARKGRDPRTGEAIDIAASKRPAFSAGKALKDAVNK